MALCPSPVECGQAHAAPPSAPPADETRFSSTIKQESQGKWTYLRGNCKVETNEMVIYADEVDHNSETHVAYLRGHVRYENYVKGDKISCDRAEYNLKTEEGTFYNVKGTSPAKPATEPWLLKTTNPFYFEGEWAERRQGRYIIHHGFITDCNIPKPWWMLHAPLFDIIPDDRAIVHHALFKVKGIPVVYFPVFYRPLGRKDRQSGFLTPNIGNSNLLGFMFGGGYYWAINRSYDAMYRLQSFSERGFAHTFDFRGKPTQTSDFDFNLYGMNDRGLKIGNNPPIDESGVQFELNARTDLPKDFVARLDFRYLSSYLFRQSFSQSFTEAIYSQVNSVGFLQKRWDNYSFDVAFERQQLFESTQSNDYVTVQKLPSVDFLIKDEQVPQLKLPVWFSLDSSFGLMTRQQPSYTPGQVPMLQSSGVIARADVAPRVMTAFSFAGFHLVPSLTLHGTGYSESLLLPNGSLNQLDTSPFFRKAGEITVDLITPSLERIFPAPKWLGQKLKHVIEPRFDYRYIGGLDNFNNTLRFDKLDILNDTNQAQWSIINRFYVKRKNGNVEEILNWQVAQDWFFDSTFGGALVPGQRNVFLTTEDVTGFSYITRPRNYSPVDSIVRLNPNAMFSLDWRVDYDPIYSRFTNNTIGTVVRFKTNFFTGVSYRELNTDPIIQGYASQISITGGYGNELRKGWNAAFLAYYDYHLNLLEYFFSQLSYNTDCCGFNFQVKRFNFGIRQENQFLFSFMIANVGQFGTLRRQDRIF